MTTELSNLVLPKVFTEYMTEMSAEKSALIQSGAVVRTAEYDALASGKGNIVEIPFFKPLTGDESVITSTGTLVQGQITAGQQTAVKPFRGRAIGIHDLAVEFTQEDILGAIMRALVPYRNERLQAQLIKTLDGVFGKALKDTHVSDISKATATKASTFSSDALIDALTLLGDSAPMLASEGIIFMHSKVYADARKANLIDYLRDENVPYEIPTLNGMRIQKDDTLPVVKAANTDDKYTTYILGTNSIIQGDGVVEYPLEDYREELKSISGIIYRRKTIIHPNGCRWIGNAAASLAPTDAVLATANNWSKVYEDDRNIKMVKLVTNITADV